MIVPVGASQGNGIEVGNLFCPERFSGGENLWVVCCFLGDAWRTNRNNGHTVYKGKGLVKLLTGININNEKDFYILGAWHTEHNFSMLPLGRRMILCCRVLGLVECLVIFEIQPTENQYSLLLLVAPIKTNFVSYQYPRVSIVKGMLIRD